MLIVARVCTLYSTKNIVKQPQQIRRFQLKCHAMMLAILDGLKVMKVIVAGYIDFENAGEVREILTSARPHIEGALEEEGCIAYSWTECHLTPGRVYVFEEWTSSQTLSSHLASHWYRDMGGHLASFARKPRTNVIKKYLVELEEPVYDDTGVARGDFFTAE